MTDTIIRHWIDGKPDERPAERLGDVFNPATGQVQARVALASPAVVDQAVAWAAAHPGRRVALLATFGPTLQSMPPEFPPGVALLPCLVEGAMAALDAGDGATHDRLVAEAARRLMEAEPGVGAIALAQFSLARAREAVQQATGLPVLTTVDSAVAELRRRLSR